MLKQLHIHNYAIIDSIQIHFSSNLNIITGETGAGKSILMGALSLILGERADTSVLLDKSRKCYIEGIFSQNSPDIEFFLKTHDLDEGSEILIRREINAGGKSRAFINDSPVTLQQLKQLSSLLVDLHQQFDTLELNSNDFQREVMDALAGNQKEMKEYGQLYKEYQESLQELAELKKLQAAANKELDYNQFLWEELNSAAFTENEIENTEAEIKLMSHAEDIKNTLSETYFTLEEGDQPIIQQLQLLQSRLQSLEKIYPDIGEIPQRLNSLCIELKDISAELDHCNNKVVYDSETLAGLNERMALGYHLFKKHQVNTTAELLEIMSDLGRQLEKVVDLEAEIKNLEKKSLEIYKKAEGLAKIISLKRKKEISPFEKKVNDLLIQVGMVNARIKVMVEEDSRLNASGIDIIAFLFNANRSERFEPIRKVASGGELSRLMLIIKSLVAQKIQLPTLIFDEIDSGISGEAARQVSHIIHKLSKDHQVITITHQPQIAARAHKHFLVYKEQDNDKIVTRIKTLTDTERVSTIATMLSGEKPTPAAFENAREMINMNN